MKTFKNFIEDVKQPIVEAASKVQPRPMPTMKDFAKTAMKEHAWLMEKLKDS